MEMQAGPFHCFAACAAAVLRQRGVSIEQSALAAKLGVPTPWCDLMVDELNLHDPHFLWTRDWLDPNYPTEAADVLANRLPCIAFFKEFGNKYLHAVVVAAFLSRKRWLIRDPWNTHGAPSQYVMRPAHLSNPQHGWTGLILYVARPRLTP